MINLLPFAGNPAVSAAGRIHFIAKLCAIMPPMKNWVIKDEISVEDKNSLGDYSDMLKHLLRHRGITNLTDAEKFLNPVYADLHDPFLILNMDKAVSRVLAAINNGEKIVVYADYDCDGIPGAVVLHDFFKKIGYSNFAVYIPHRYREGYGLNIVAIEKFAGESVNLVITVDTGIADVEPVAKANELGIDVIITDHHLPQEKLPEAYTIINSKQEEDSYPFDMLCGAAVAFKLVLGLIKKGNFNLAEGWEKWLLDAVGISTIADMVPLVGENRILASCGLKVLRKTRRPGLLSLFSLSKIRQNELNEDDVGYSIAPKINAASRMGDPVEGFRFLSACSFEEAELLANYIDEKNDERKKAVSSIVKEAEGGLEIKEDKKVVVVGNLKWFPGLVGLAANKIAEKYKKAVFVWGKEGATQIRGSCRSDGFVNIVDLMQVVGKDFFIDFGGHALAGGFSLIEEKIGKLQDRLNDAYDALVGSNVSRDQESIKIDKKMSLDEVNWTMYSIIEKLSPFGIDNPKPIFLFEGVEIFNARKFGDDSNYAFLDFKQRDGKIVSAVTFDINSLEADDKLLEPNRLVDLVATMEKTNYRSRPELRLRIVDLRHSF